MLNRCWMTLRYPHLQKSDVSTPQARLQHQCHCTESSLRAASPNFNFYRSGCMPLSLPIYFQSVPDKAWFMYGMKVKGESERLNCQVTPPSAKGFKKWANALASLMRSLMPRSSTTATIKRRCRGDRWAKTSAKASRSSTAEKRAEGTSCWRSLNKNGKSKCQGKNLSPPRNTSSTQCKDHAS